MVKRLRRLIIFPTVGMMLVLVTFISVYMMMSISDFSADISQNSVRVASRGIRAYVEEFEQRSAIIAYFLANDPQLIQMVRDGGSHIELLAYLNDAKEIADVDFFVLVDQDGRVLVRTHAPERYGDIALPSPAFFAARDEGIAISTYHSSPTTPMSHSSTAPIYYNGEFLGIIISNLFISEPAFTHRMREIFDAEITVYFGHRAVASTLFDLDSAEYIYADNEIAVAVLENRGGFDSRITVGGVNYFTYHFPLMSSEGAVMGMMSAAFSSAAADALNNALLRGVLVIGLAAAVIAILIYLLVVSRISKPIIKATERRQRLNDANPVPASIWDHRNNQLYDCNEALLKLFGFSSKQEAAGRFFECLPAYQPCGAPTADKFAAVQEEAFEKGSVVLKWVYVIPDTGELVPCEITVVRIETDEGPLAAAYLHDLREIEAAREKERKAIQREQQIYDATPIPATLWSSDNKMLDCTDITLKLFGISDKQELGANFSITSPTFQPCGTPSADKQLQQTQETIEKGNVRDKWVHIIPHTGELVPGEVITARIDLDGDYVVAAYFLDMREIEAAKEKERKAYEQALKNEHQAIMAERESKAKTRFLAQISHEIRTPMNAILGIAEIQLQNENLLEEFKESLSRIRSSSYLLLAIINNLLDLSKVEAGKMEIYTKPYEAIGLIVDTVQLNMIHIGSKRVELAICADPKLPFTLVGDELRVKQVLNNILSNALKYTAEGTVTLSVDALRDGDGLSEEVTLVIRVKDTGRGMTEAQVRRLFHEEYIRFNEDDAIEGSGLGMAITHRLIGMMNGKIEVKSELGKGTLITLYIPQKFSGSPVIGEEYAERLRNFEFAQMAAYQVADFIREPMPYGRVLVVDDVEVNLYVVKGHLAPYKLRVTTALSGFEALDKINGGEDYDVIFMDHMMPQMDGVETVRILREGGYKGAIVALTANALVGNDEMFIQNGFDGFISKPIDIRELSLALSKFVSGRHPEEAEKYKGKTVDVYDVPTGVSPELLRMFLRDADKSIAALRENPARDDSKLFTTIVHSMKSALGNIGEKELSAKALQLENAGQTGDLAYIDANIHRFIERLASLARKIQKSLSQGTEAPIPADPGYLAEALRNIQAACENYQIKEAVAALDELLTRPWKKETAAPLQKMRDALFLDSDFDTALEVLNLLL